MASPTDDSASAVAPAKTFPRPNRTVAQAWLDAGAVFPVVMRGKDKVPACRWRPKDEHGRTRPLTLEEAKTVWLSRGARDAMLGLDCQAMAMLVIDLDPKNGGIENFNALCREHGIDIGDCPMVRTPTGGVHLFFADPEGRWRNSTSKLARGVDTRGVGGYVVGAGSFRRGYGVYEPERPATLTEFIERIAGGRLPLPPKPLAELLDAHCRGGARPRAASSARVTTGAAAVRPSTSSGPSKPPSLNEDLSAGVSGSWTLERSLAEVETAVPGTRNDTFARQAFTAGLRSRELGLDPDQTIDALIDAARTADEAASRLGAESIDAKTTDTITRCFKAGMRQADEEAAAMAALGPATVATSAAGGATGWTAAHEAAALKRAKSSLHNAFKVAQALGQHRIRSSLVRIALTVPDARLRARLMFALAAFLLKSNHAPEEIVGAVVACGFPRTHAAHTFTWAQKNIAKGGAGHDR